MPKQRESGQQQRKGAVIMTAKEEKVLPALSRAPLCASASLSEAYACRASLCPPVDIAKTKSYASD